MRKVPAKNNGFPAVLASPIVGTPQRLLSRGTGGDSDARIDTTTLDCLSIHTCDALLLQVRSWHTILGRNNNNQIINKLKSLYKYTYSENEISRERRPQTCRVGVNMTFHSRQLPQHVSFTSISTQFRSHSSLETRSSMILTALRTLFVPSSFQDSWW
jgi:hypothetical protein